MITAALRAFRGIRTGLVVLPLMGIFIVGGVIVRLAVRSESRRLPLHAGLTHVICRIGVSALRVRRSVEAFDQCELPKNPVLYAANHLSYLDIIVLASIRPMLFISSVEVRQTAFLGLMARLGGTVFVERRSAAGLRREIGRIAGILGSGLSVCIFPEGTTSPGTGVLPFKSPLLASAGTAGVPVVPVCIDYRGVNGAPFDDRTRDIVCWYGDMTFAPHFLRLLCVRHVDVAARFCDPVPPDSGMDRKRTAELARAAIIKVFQTA